MQQKGTYTQQANQNQGQQVPPQSTVPPQQPQGQQPFTLGLPSLGAGYDLMRGSAVSDKTRQAILATWTTMLTESEHQHYIANRMGEGFKFLPCLHISDRSGFNAPPYMMMAVGLVDTVQPDFSVGLIVILEESGPPMGEDTNINIENKLITVPRDPTDGADMTVAQSFSDVYKVNISKWGVVVLGRNDIKRDEDGGVNKQSVMDYCHKLRLDLSNMISSVGFNDPSRMALIYYKPMPQEYTTRADSPYRGGMIVARVTRRSEVQTDDHGFDWVGGNQTLTVSIDQMNNHNGQSSRSNPSLPYTTAHFSVDLVPVEDRMQQPMMNLYWQQQQQANIKFAPIADIRGVHSEIGTNPVTMMLAATMVKGYMMDGPQGQPAPFYGPMLSASTRFGGGAKTNLNNIGVITAVTGINKPKDAKDGGGFEVVNAPTDIDALMSKPTQMGVVSDADRWYREYIRPAQAMVSFTMTQGTHLGAAMAAVLDIAVSTNPQLDQDLHRLAPILKRGEAAVSRQRIFRILDNATKGKLSGLWSPEQEMFQLLPTLTWAGISKQADHHDRSLKSQDIQDMTGFVQMLNIAMNYDPESVRTLVAEYTKAGSPDTLRLAAEMFTKARNRMDADFKPMFLSQRVAVSAGLINAFREAMTRAYGVAIQYGDGLANMNQVASYDYGGYVQSSGFMLYDAPQPYGQQPMYPGYQSPYGNQPF